jgi:hypothetical protein
MKIKKLTGKQKNQQPVPSTENSSQMSSPRDIKNVTTIKNHATTLVLKIKM